MHSTTELYSPVLVLVLSIKDIPASDDTSKSAGHLPQSFPTVFHELKSFIEPRA